MWTVSRWALTSVAALAVATAIHVLGREKCWVVASIPGFERAFYWSPLALLAIKAVLILGVVAGSVGLLVGPGMTRRTQAAVAALGCVGGFLFL